jgi:type 1 glutamine amidotransferase
MGAFGPLSSVFAAEQASAAAVAPPVKRVLLLTGEDYPGHKWRETTPVLRTQLEQDTRLGIHVVEDLKFLRSPELHTFAAIVMHFKNYDPAVPGPEGQENLARFVRQGGGAVLVHFACGAFQEWPDFVQLAGRVWDPKLRGHDPHGSFRVDIVDSQHPITQGFPAFDVTDELYTCLAGETPREKVLRPSFCWTVQVGPTAFTRRVRAASPGGSNSQSTGRAESGPPRCERCGRSGRGQQSVSSLAFHPVCSSSCDPCTRIVAFLRCRQTISVATAPDGCNAAGQRCHGFRPADPFVRRHIGCFDSSRVVACTR